MNSHRTIGTWSARNTGLGDVDAAVRRLRGLHERGALRTAASTIVAVADDDTALAAELTEVVRELATLTPIHSLVLSVAPSGEPGIDAGVRVRALERGGGPVVCVDEVSIRVRGPASRHLDHVVAPLVLPEIPLVVWLPKRLPRDDEPLLSVAAGVLVDTHRLPAPVRFADLATISDRLPMTDLTWIRLEPWRQIIAGLFVGAEFSPFLRGVYRVEVHGETPAMLLLAGWLMSRLRLTSSDVDVTDADASFVGMWSAYGGRQASFAVAQGSSRHELQVSAIIEDGPSYHRTFLLPECSLACVIARALVPSVTDEAWKQVVAVVDELSGPDQPFIDGD